MTLRQERLPGRPKNYGRDMFVLCIDLVDELDSNLQLSSQPLLPALLRNKLFNRCKQAKGFPKRTTRHKTLIKSTDYHKLFVTWKDLDGVTRFSQRSHLAAQLLARRCACTVQTFPTPLSPSLPISWFRSASRPQAYSAQANQTASGKILRSTNN